MPFWRPENDFDGVPSQQSAAIPLTANTPYYFEILHKEGFGGDHVSVAWAYESQNYENFALASKGSTATQSTTGWGGVAARAIDGYSGGNSITHTNNEPNPWLLVNFGQDRSINRVKLWNRINDGCQPRLSNFRISVLNASYRLKDCPFVEIWLAGFISGVRKTAL